MNVKKTRSYKTLVSGDKLFTFSPDGVTLVPRASIVIDETCPDSYSSLIAQAYNRGWIKCAAHLPDVEYTMELLKED